MGREQTYARAAVLVAVAVLAACAQGPARTADPSPARAPVSTSATMPGPVALFSYPVVAGIVFSPYGAPRSGGQRRHSGTDISAPQGTPVHAAGAGVVRHAGYGYQGSAAWGQAVVIDHGAGWVTLYAHLSAVDVVVGQALLGGEQIGLVGRTGNATGPHLHLEVRHNGESVDPQSHIPGIGAAS